MQRGGVSPGEQEDGRLGIGMLHEHDGFRVGCKRDGQHGRAQPPGAAPKSIDEDFRVPSRRRHPGSPTILPCRDFNYVFRMIPALVDHQVFLVVIDNHLAGHARGNRSQMPDAQGDAGQDRRVVDEVPGSEQGEGWGGDEEVQSPVRRRGK